MAFSISNIYLKIYISFDDSIIVDQGCCKSIEEKVDEEETVTSRNESNENGSLREPDEEVDSPTDYVHSSSSDQRILCKA